MQTSPSAGIGSSSPGNTRGSSSWGTGPSGILAELSVSGSRSPGRGGVSQRVGERRGARSGVSYTKGASLVPSSPPPPGLSLINSVAGDALLFSETNMDWTKLNIFRTRLCDRLTQTHSCHMANRCLFSHDVHWP